LVSKIISGTGQEFAPKDWGTMKECAEHFGISRQRVHQLILKDKLGDCEKVLMPAMHNGGGIWMIPKPFKRS